MTYMYYGCLQPIELWFIDFLIRYVHVYTCTVEAIDNSSFSPFIFLSLCSVCALCT